jgi:hypothetical protein
VKFVDYFFQDCLRVATLHINCKQHQAGLSIQDCTLFLDVLNPCFCASKQLRKARVRRAFLAAARRLIERNVKIVTVEPQPVVNKVLMENILEASYYNIDVALAHKMHAEKDALMEADRTRRDKGRLFASAFTGDPRKPATLGIDHHCNADCPNGACADDAEAAALMIDRFEDMLPKRWPSPALNKWLQTAPVISIFTFLSQCFGLLGLAWLGMSSRGAIDDGSDSEDNEGHIMSARELDHREYRRTDRHRNRRVSDFVGDASSIFRLAIWNSVAHYILHVHHVLFRDGKLSGRTVPRLSCFFRE